MKNENRKSYLGHKEQKVMFPVISWSDEHFGFVRPFFLCWLGVQVKLGARKIGRDEVNLSRPVKIL